MPIEITGEHIVLAVLAVGGVVAAALDILTGDQLIYLFGLVIAFMGGQGYQRQKMLSMGYVLPAAAEVEWKQAEGRTPANLALLFVGLAVALVFGAVGGIQGWYKEIPVEWGAGIVVGIGVAIYAWWRMRTP